MSLIIFQEIIATNQCHSHVTEAKTDQKDK